MSDSVLSDCRIIELPKIPDHRGNLTFIEGEKHIPFPIKRVFYVYDVPGGASRGAHAHRELEQFLICVSGALDVYLDDGYEKRTVHLNRANEGLYIPPMIWASEGNFDTGTVYLVLASRPYDESDYYRDYDQFLAAVRGRTS
ncbi:MAG: WxcM-like domain-containing protein [Clostridia bacterium]|nr:WxcM-like domain-containing protein [Clostridia bacterium]